MVYAVIDEVIPESQERGNADLATLGTILGFIAMTAPDVALS